LLALGFNWPLGVTITLTGVGVLFITTLINKFLKTYAK